MKLKVYFLHIDNSKESLKMELYDDVDIYKAFEKEDGDGDETGSWSNSVYLITDYKGNVLYKSFEEQKMYGSTNSWEMQYRFQHLDKEGIIKKLNERSEKEKEAKKQLKQNFLKRMMKSKYIKVFTDEILAEMECYIGKALWKSKN